MTDAALDEIRETVRAAAAARRPLAIRGGGTKVFYGGAAAGDALDTGTLTGVVDYAPTELVISARAGTPLAAVEAQMRAEGQMLAFEPPRFAPGGTLGGAVATGLSGPRRPWSGAVRDFVLGVRVIDGTGEDLRFGGRVMKNVAGFDVARLMPEPVRNRRSTCCHFRWMIPNSGSRTFRRQKNCWAGSRRFHSTKGLIRQLLISGSCWTAISLH
jgi:FAD/FMN-containing dehydrogenase